MYGMLPHTMKQHFPPPKPAKFVNISPQTKSTTATTPAQSLESQVQWYFIVCIKKKTGFLITESAFLGDVFLRLPRPVSLVVAADSLV